MTLISSLSTLHFVENSRSLIAIGSALRQKRASATLELLQGYSKSKIGIVRISTRDFGDRSFQLTSPKTLESKRCGRSGGHGGGGLWVCRNKDARFSPGRTAARSPKDDVIAPDLTRNLVRKNLSTIRDHTSVTRSLLFAHSLTPGGVCRTADRKTSKLMRGVWTAGRLSAIFVSIRGLVVFLSVMTKRRRMGLDFCRFSRSSGRMIGRLNATFYH